MNNNTKSHHQEQLLAAIQVELQELELPNLVEDIKLQVIPGNNSNTRTTTRTTTTRDQHQQHQQKQKHMKRDEYIPETILFTNRTRISSSSSGDGDGDANDDCDENCSLISSLTLPQEIALLRTISEKHHELNNNNNKKKKKIKNKVKPILITTKRPGTDSGDLPLNRAQGLRIEVIKNKKRLSGIYSGGLSPRNSKPYGIGVIKFDNGGMFFLGPLCVLFCCCC